MLLPRSDALVKDTVVVCATAGQGLSVYRGRLHTNEASGAIRMRGGEYLERGKGGGNMTKTNGGERQRQLVSPFFFHQRRLSYTLAASLIVSDKKSIT